MKAPRLRFSLSILFAAMALAAIPLAWRANAVSRQNDAIATMLASGVDVAFFASSGEEISQLDFLSGDDVVGVSIAGRWLDDPATLPSSVLLSLNSFGSLERLEIDGFDLTSHNVASLDGSKTLKEFEWVIDPEIKTERAAEVVGALAERYPNLESVSLFGPPATDDDLRPLAHLARLRSLRLIEGDFDGTFLSSLEGERLEEVQFISDRFAPWGFAELIRFRKLRYVDVTQGSLLPRSSLHDAVELNFVETLAFCVEPGPLPDDVERALTAKNSPAVYAGFSNLADSEVPSEGWLYERWPIRTK